MSKKKNITKKAPPAGNKIDAKKAAVLGTDRKSKLPLVIGAVCAVIIVGAAVWVANLKGGGSSSVVATASGDSKVVAIPANLFDDGKARHFEYASGEFTIRYFVIKSSDGVIRAAYDACDVCWPANKGYFQEGDHMVCRNCGRKFASVLVNEVKGGCNPAPLNRSVQDGNVILHVKDILDGKQFFNFSGKV